MSVMQKLLLLLVVTLAVLASLRTLVGITGSIAANGGARISAARESFSATTMAETSSPTPPRVGTASRNGEAAPVTDGAGKGTVEAPRGYSLSGGKAMSYAECFDYLNKTSTMADASQENGNWTIINNNEHTRRIIEESGGLTDLMKVFMNVYEKKVWGKGSGSGSYISFASPTICALSSIIPHLLRVDLMIDIPCGDQQWAPTLRKFTPGLKYIGVDIMPGLISTHRERFKTNGFPKGSPYNPNIEFFLSDMSSRNVFEQVRNQSRIWKADDTVAVLSRHVLEHNKYSVIFKYLKELKASSTTYFIGTNAAKWQKNGPLGILGGFRFINFHKFPFFFPPPIVTWTEDIYNLAGGKDGPFTEIAIWRVADLPSTFHERIRG